MMSGSTPDRESRNGSPQNEALLIRPAASQKAIMAGPQLLRVHPAPHSPTFPMNPLTKHKRSLVQAADDQVAASVYIDAERLRRQESRQERQARLKRRVYTCMAVSHITAFWILVGIVIWNSFNIQVLIDKSTVKFDKMSANVIDTTSLSVSSSNQQSVSISSSSSSASVSVSSATGPSLLTLSSANKPVQLQSNNGALTIKAGDTPVLQASLAGTVVKGNFSTDAISATTLSISAMSSPTIFAEHDSRQLVSRAVGSKGMQLFMDGNLFSVTHFGRRVIAVDNGNLYFDSPQLALNGLVVTNTSFSVGGLNFTAGGVYSGTTSNFTISSPNGIILDAGNAPVTVTSNLRISPGATFSLSALQTPEGSDELTLIAPTRIRAVTGEMLFSNVSASAAVVRSDRRTLMITTSAGPDGTSWSAFTYGDGGNGTKGPDVAVIAGSGSRGGSSGTFGGNGGSGGDGGNVILAAGVGGNTSALDTFKTSRVGRTGEVIVTEGNFRIAAAVPTLILGSTNASRSLAWKMNVTSGIMTLSDAAGSFPILSASSDGVTIDNRMLAVAGQLDQSIVVQSSAASAQVLLQGSTRASLCMNNVFCSTAHGVSNMSMTTQTGLATGRSVAVLSDGSVRFSNGLLSFGSNELSFPSVLLDHASLNLSSSVSLGLGAAVLSTVSGNLLIQHGSSFLTMGNTFVNMTSVGQITVEGSQGTVVVGSLFLKDPLSNSRVTMNITGFYSDALSLRFADGRLRVTAVESDTSLYLRGVTAGIWFDESQPVRGVNPTTGALGNFAITMHNSTISSAYGDLTLQPAAASSAPVSSAVVVGGSGLFRVGAVLLNASDSSLLSPVARFDTLTPRLSSYSGSGGLQIQSHVDLTLQSVASNVVIQSTGVVQLLQGANVVTGSMLTVNHANATVASTSSLSFVSPSVIYLNASDSVRVGMLSQSSTSLYGIGLSIDFANSAIAQVNRNLSVSASDTLLLQGNLNGVVLQGRTRITASSSSLAVDFGSRMISTNSAAEPIVLYPHASTYVQVAGGEMLQFGTLVVPSSLRIKGNFLEQTMQGANLKIDFILNRITAVTEPMQIIANRSLMLTASEGILITGSNQRFSDGNGIFHVDFAASKVYTTSGDITMEGALATRILTGPNGLFLQPNAASLPLVVTIGAIDSTFSMERPAATSATTFSTLFKAQDACLNCGTGGSFRLLSGKGSGTGFVAGPLVLEAGSGESGAGGGNVVISAGIGSSSSDGRVLVETRGMHVYTRGASYRVFEVNTIITDGDSVLIGNVDMTYSPAQGPYTDLIKSRAITQHHYAASTYRLHTEAALITGTLMEFGDFNASNAIGFPQEYRVRAQQIRFTDESVVDSLRTNLTSTWMYRPTTLQLQTDSTAGTLIEIGDTTLNNKFPDNLKLRGRTITMMDEIASNSFVVTTTSAWLYRPTMIQLQTDSTAGTLIEIGDTTATNKFPDNLKLRGRTITLVDETPTSSFIVTTTSATLQRSSLIEIGTPTGTATTDVNIRGATVRIMNGVNALTSAMIEATATHLYLRVTGGSQVQVLGGDVNIVNGKLKEANFDLIPTGSIMMFDGTSCPSGWTAYTVPGGRVIASVPTGQSPAVYGSAFTSTADATPGTGRVVSMTGTVSLPYSNNNPSYSCGCGTFTGSLNSWSNPVALSVSTRVGDVVPIAFMLFCRKI